MLMTRIDDGDDDDDTDRLYFYAAIHRLVEGKSRSRRIIHRVQPSKYIVTLDRDQEVIISNLSAVLFIITVIKIITKRTSHRGQGSRCQETCRVDSVIFWNWNFLNLNNDLTSYYDCDGGCSDNCNENDLGTLRNILIMSSMTMMLIMMIFFDSDYFKDLVTTPSLLHSSDRSVNVFGINLRNTTWLLIFKIMKSFDVTEICTLGNWKFGRKMKSVTSKMKVFGGSRNLLIRKLVNL